MCISFVDSATNAWGPCLFNGTAHVAILGSVSALIAAIALRCFEQNYLITTGLITMGMLSGTLALTGVAVLGIITGVACTSLFFSSI